MNKLDIDTSELITEIINTIDCYRYIESMTGEECVEQITEIIQKSMKVNLSTYKDRVVL